MLVIEDEESYRTALASGLGNEGFDVVLASDGIEGLRRFQEERPDIVLLDLQLPGMNGTDVCRQIHAVAPVPIILVSAVDSELDVVLGLEIGATDYVTKPYRMRELIARMHAILRRVGTTGSPGSGGPDGDLGILGPELPIEDGRTETFGPVVVDFVRREVSVDGNVVHLSRKEFDLLATLLSPIGRVRTRFDLIDRLWPDQYLADSRTLDTHMHRLRSKLEPDPTNPRFIVTVRGIGFRIDKDGTVSTPPSRNF